MLVIRLARGGRSKYPTYRIVAAESARAATGKFIEILGHYNPHTKELVLKKEEILSRISNGAQPSNTVVKLLQREKVELPAWVKLKTKAHKESPKEEPKPAAKAETPPTEPAKDEVRVAEAATDNAIETAENDTPAGKTETAEDTEAAAKAAVDAEAA